MKKIAFILALIQMLCVFSGIGVYAADVAVIDTLQFQDSKIGIFTEKDSVKLDFTFTSKLQSITSYRFEVTDVWERMVTEGVFTIPVGKKVATLDFGKFNVGWYRATIYDNISGRALDNYITFSVTHDPAKRKVFESTPFAAALAGEYDAFVRNDPFIVADAFKKAGITYVRNVGSGWLETTDPIVKKGFNQYGIDEVSYHDGNALRYNTSVSSADYMAFTSDLISIYNNWKEISKANYDYAEAIEILNEIDNGFYGTTGTSDNFAAFTKVAAIALADSSLGDPLAIMNGWASASNTGFVTWALQNDIAKYSAAYNYHTHDNSFSRLSTAVNAVNAYGDANAPVWGTEIGTPYYLAGSETHIKDSALLDSAASSVKKTMNHLARGSSKVFAFLLRPYLENGKDYGYFATPEWLPYPMFSSLSAMTYALGEGIIKGEIANLNDETTGLLFDNGAGSDVAVLWSQNQCYVDIYADKVTFMDLVGYEEEKIDEDGDGKIKICVTSEPVYIMFNGRSAVENYYPYEYKADTAPTQKKFTTAERVIIQPLWGDKDPKSIREIGHYIYGQDENSVKLEVYNFNNTAVKGTIDIICPEDLTFNKQTVSYSVAPMSKTEIPLKITLKEGTPTGTSSFIKFAGKLDSGEALSNCVSKYYVNNGSRTISKENIIAFENIWDTKRWNLDNHGAGTKISAQGVQSDNTITINQVAEGTNDWGYPFFYIEDTSIFEGTAGVIFEVKNTGHIKEGSTYWAEQLQMFLHMKDGRQYKTNYSTPKSREWTQVVYPWSAFYLYSSPEGMFETKTLDFNDIQAISIGTNSADIRTIRNFGVFFSDVDSDKLDSDKTVNFSGMTEGGHYTTGSDNMILTAEVPNEKIINIQVFNGRDKLENFVVDGNKVIIDFTNMGRGKYNIMVSAESEYNFQYMNNFSFYID